MTKEEQREQVVQSLADMLRTSLFQVELKVKKKPAGIKIVIEVTEEQMESLVKRIHGKTAS